jgi:carbonic anhydrase
MSAVVAAWGGVWETEGRSWRDIEPHHAFLVSEEKGSGGVAELDVSARFYRNVEELHYMSMVMRPAGASYRLVEETLTRDGERTGAAAPWEERQPTTIRPSPAPSASPSALPTAGPTFAPTLEPSTAPSRKPTTAPTVDPYTPNEPPLDPDPAYFNYDTSPTALYGPGQLVAQQQQPGGFYTTTMVNNQWGNVQRPVEFGYWDEFTATAGFGAWKQTLEIHQPWRNKCAIGTLQSPIDLVENGGVCQEHHQVRSLPGEFGLAGNRVKKLIEPNKLRLLYQRRPCSDLANPACQEPDPPSADFPSGWAGFADVLHIDFKLPSEHTIKGERFDAEMQIFHLHPGRRRLVAQAVVMRAQQNGYNYYFQAALDAFQIEFDRRMEACRTNNRRHLAETSHDNDNGDYESWAKFYTFGGAGPRERFDFGGGPWDPHHPMLLPTIYFYRYDGSLTEPPCGEFVTWWVADRPMTIGLDQLEQMQRLLFLSLDTNCTRMSVQHGRSVARPLQKINNRPVWRCTPSNFGPD